MLQNTEESRSLPEKVGERRSPRVPAPLHHCQQGVIGLIPLISKTYSLQAAAECGRNIMHNHSHLANSSLVKAALLGNFFPRLKSFG